MEYPQTFSKDTVVGPEKRRKSKRERKERTPIFSGILVSKVESGTSEFSFLIASLISLL